MFDISFINKLKNIEIFMNNGFISLAVVAALFLALQVWWIGMTIRNGRNERVRTNQSQTDEIKKNINVKMLG